jgi:alkylation response protein AidB-like acyl-CoA dehydrogenase
MVELDVDAWVGEHWRRDLTLRSWWLALAEAGLAFPRWPVADGGRGWATEDVRRRDHALHGAGAIGAPTGLGTLMGAPIVLGFGTAEQRRRLLPPLADGTEGWCQLFSEPGAGSDLAGLTTKAERDGDQWVVTGQKVWTSGAQVSRRGMLVARSNTDVPKHRGLTYFVVDMEQPGIEVRPLRQMNGAAHFSEVFLTEARVDDADRIGAVGDGWAVTVATLAHERSGLSEGSRGVTPPAGERAGFLDRTVGEIIDGARGRVSASSAAVGSARRLLELADAAGRRDDPVARQRLAALASAERIAAWSRAGSTNPSAASLAKLGWTQGLRAARDLAVELQGATGTLAAPDAPGDGDVQDFVLSVPSASIAGGSDEIQRNIIAERGLGLPKDVQVDRDVPFRDVLKGAAR